MHSRVSRSIEEVSRIYREEANLNGSRICRGYVKQIESTRFWLDGQTYLSRNYRGCRKEGFQGGKTHKMRKQQDGYSNNHPSNMLSTQTTPQLQMQSIPRSTNTLNKSNQLYISKIFKTVQQVYINTCIPCDGQNILYLHMYQEQQRVCVLCVKT